MERRACRLRTLIESPDLTFLMEPRASSTPRRTASVGIVPPAQQDRALSRAAAVRHARAVGAGDDAVSRSRPERLPRSTPDRGARRRTTARGRDLAGVSSARTHQVRGRNGRRTIRADVPSPSVARSVSRGVSDDALAVGASVVPRLAADQAGGHGVRPWISERRVVFLMQLEELAFESRVGGGGEA